MGASLLRGTTVMQATTLMQDLLAVQDHRPVTQEVLLEREVLEREVLDMQGQVAVATTVQVALLVVHHPAKAIEKMKKAADCGLFFG